MFVLTHNMLIRNLRTVSLHTSLFQRTSEWPVRRAGETLGSSPPRASPRGGRFTDHDLIPGRSFAFYRRVPWPEVPGSSSLPHELCAVAHRLMIFVLLFF